MRLIKNIRMFDILQTSCSYSLSVMYYYTTFYHESLLVAEAEILQLHNYVSLLIAIEAITSVCTLHVNTGYNKLFDQRN